MVKNPPANVGDPGFIPGLERSPGGEHGNPLQYSCLLLLLLSRFSHVQLCATPETAAHQAPPSLGFSRQETLEWVAISFNISS